MRARAARTLTVVFVSLGLAAAGCKKDEAKPGQPTSGDKVVEGAQKMGEGIAEGAKAAWEATKEGAKVVGAKVAEGAKVVGDKVAAGAKVVAAEATDTWITAKIKAKIGVGRLFGVSVDTAAGQVTLSGQVSSAAEKDEIEKYARETSGVKSITNNLTVQGAAAAPAVPAPAAPAK